MRTRSKRYVAVVGFVTTRRLLLTPAFLAAVGLSVGIEVGGRQP